jgi:hypothetical protein
MGPPTECLAKNLREGWRVLPDAGGVMSLVFVEDRISSGFGGING